MQVLNVHAPGGISVTPAANAPRYETRPPATSAAAENQVRQQYQPTGYQPPQSQPEQAMPHDMQQQPEAPQPSSQQQPYGDGSQLSGSRSAYETSAGIRFGSKPWQRS
jgi:hypothetical protein